MTKRPAFPDLNAVPKRALSMLQPYASAIVHLGKSIENRVERGPWRGGCSFRGEILIHASNWPTTENVKAESVLEMVETARDCVAIAKAHGTCPSRDVLPSVTPADLLAARGCILGRARVVGVVEREFLNHGEWGVRDGDGWRELTPAERAWWTGGFGLVLADVAPLPLVPCKGALGFWEVPIEARRALMEAA